MEKLHIHKYGSREYKDFLNQYSRSSKDTPRLLVLAGEYETERSYAIEELKRETEGDIVEVDLEDIIELAEKKSYANTDKMIEELNPNAELILFRNGAILNGEYTGFTASAVKYATPQEKYFLKKIKSIPALKVIELGSAEFLDRRLVNEADYIFLFTAPDSFLEKIIWNLKSVHVHGSRFYSPRKA